MIKYFEIEGFHGNRDYQLSFDSDLNILTGKNGSGKTTLLKLLWYCLSGNLERIRAEMAFRRAYLETSSLKLKISAQPGDSDPLFDLEIDGKKVEIPAEFARRQTLGELIPSGTSPRAIAGFAYLKQAISSIPESSIFFPTFRRIEGGYTVERRGRLTSKLIQAGPLQSALSEFSDALEVGSHQFVASISTEDIVSLLTSKFAEISEQTNRLHVSLSEFITKTIRDYGQEPAKAGAVTKLRNAEARLAQIQEKISEIETQRSLLLRPFAVLAKLVERIFQHRGIKLTEAITFGEAAECISSDKLSAGEKQMLSFLCYNAFSSSSCIFIDEPEISLHVDWQRTLFPTLLEQSTSNQFIVATHSPFIYSKYSEKELVLNPDRGGN